MSDRLRNNIIACFIVFAFWIIFVFPVMVHAADPIVTQSTSTSTVTTSTDTDTRVRTNPPSAISPSVSSNNSDVCAMGWSGSVQTQILGISTGRTYRDLNCERLKIASKLYDMGMKVAAVAVMCQDWRTYDAMLKAGTPCPIAGLIGEEAAIEWKKNPRMQPIKEPVKVDKGEWLEKLADGIIAVVLMALLIA
ncbi:MAG: hypothetical protein QF535_12860 [Anaerolineales bacterium]|jgi:hypothetical protein|nr:hypothetical protein [Anaerolineales bacterium]|tara:strand:- start:553 stop:1131 length:579 start_codon:yes stop_codon:yes gene_type:complete